MEAVLFKSKQWFIPVSVLRVRTADGAYQFGFNPWCRIEAHLPFETTTERVQLSYSPFSLLIRLALVGYLVYWLWTRFS